jgi:NADPH2:quinone reductase
VKVHACGLNRADVLQARMLAQGPSGNDTVIGMEWAGEVVELGPDVTSVKCGDRVMGSGKAAFAEQVAVDGGRLFHIPASMSFEQAAALPMALTTMHDAIVTNGRLQPGQSVLVQGASSGVGLIGLQIAKIKGAAKVIGTSTNPDRRARLSEFGADLAIDSRAADWVGQVLGATNGNGADLTIDQVSGETANGNLAATKVTGRIVNVGRLSQLRGDFDFDLHAARRITYIGVTFRTRSVQEVREIFRRVQEDIWPEVETGGLHMPIGRIYKFQELPDALARMASNQHFGKLIISISGR